MACPVALVVVSHSDLIARGVVEVAAQMAPDVHLAPAGGTADGGIGTSFDAVLGAVEAALGVEGVTSVVLTADLGSAVMTAESVIDLADGDVRLAGGPVVEGTVAGAVRAQLGDDADAVAAACAGATDGAGPGPDGPVAPAIPQRGEGAGSDDAEHVEGSDDAENSDSAEGTGPGEAPLRREVTIVNQQGLHARPAALLARTAGSFDAEVLVNDVEADSVITLMGLGAAQGETVAVTATGPQAAQALDAVVTLISDGLGDL